MADGNFTRINEANPRTLTKAALEVGTEGNEGRGHPLDKAPIADQTGELLSPITANMVLIEVLEVAIVRRVEGYHQGHDFAQAQSARALTTLETLAEQLSLPLGFKFLAEVIDMVEQVF